MDREAYEDLRERLTRADAELAHMSAGGAGDRHEWLRGKQAGIGLALDYLRAYDQAMEDDEGADFEWCVMHDRSPREPHRGPMSEQEARQWVQEWEEMGEGKARKGMFYVARRSVGRWQRVESDK